MVLQLFTPRTISPKKKSGLSKYLQHTYTVYALENTLQILPKLKSRWQYITASHIVPVGIKSLCVPLGGAQVPPA